MANHAQAIYPMRTDPMYRHYIWGGTRLAALLGKPMGPEGTLAESWEVGDDARVANGPWQGRTLRDVDEATGGALGGDVPHYLNARLPLLIKLSNAAADLSVQIHPTDEQALRDDAARGYPGKDEMYVILEAASGAGVYWGLRDGVQPWQLEAAARAGTGIADLLNFVPVRAGDILYTPAGVVHAIGTGVVYCEIQENSDITYRLYDWGRVDAEGKPRPLHLEQGMAVLHAPRQTGPAVHPLSLPLSAGVGSETRFMQTATGIDSYEVPVDSPGRRMMLCACPHFATELLELDGAAPLARARNTMRAVIVLEGRVTLRGGGEQVSCETGQSAVLPAALSDAWVVPDGHVRVLLSYVPDMAADVVAPLRAAGYSAEQIAHLGDVPLT